MRPVLAVQYEDVATDNWDPQAGALRRSQTQTKPTCPSISSRRPFSLINHDRVPQSDATLEAMQPSRDKQSLASRASEGCKAWGSKHGTGGGGDQGGSSNQAVGHGDMASLQHHLPAWCVGLGALAWTTTYRSLSSCGRAAGWLRAACCVLLAAPQLFTRIPDHSSLKLSHPDSRTLEHDDGDISGFAIVWPCPCESAAASWGGALRQFAASRPHRAGL